MITTSTSALGISARANMSGQQSNIARGCMTILVNGMRLKKLGPAPHHVVRFHQDLVVLAEGHQEHDGGDLLKTMDPLPPLRTLAANIHHSRRAQDNIQHIRTPKGDSRGL